MNIHPHLVACLAAAGILFGGAPAQAGTNWGSPQEISSQPGTSIRLSKDGRIAAWVRTKHYYGNGPVRTAYYKSAKKGWTPSAAVVGTTGITEVQLSADGNTLFAESPGTGYVLAQRSSRNEWGAATTVVKGIQADGGQMSSNADTIAWADWAGAQDYPTTVPGTVYVMTRAVDSSWSAPAAVGAIPYNIRYNGMSLLALSRNGSAIAWIDDTFALKVTTRNSDGSWAPPVLVKQYAFDPQIDDLQFDAAGDTLIWRQDDAEGVLCVGRTSSGWSPAGYVTTDEVTETAISPNGEVVAYATRDKKLRVRTWNGTVWASPKTLGSAGFAWLAVTNGTIAWTKHKFSPTTLWASVYAKKKWQPSAKCSGAAWSPVVAVNGRTLAWSTPKRIHSVHR